MVARPMIYILRKKKKPKISVSKSPALGFAGARAEGAERAGAWGQSLLVPRAGHLPGRVPAMRAGWAGEYISENMCDLKHVEMGRAPCSPSCSSTQSPRCCKGFAFTFRSLCLSDLCRWPGGLIVVRFGLSVLTDYGQGIFLASSKQALSTGSLLLNSVSLSLSCPWSAAPLTCQHQLAWGHVPAGTTATQLTSPLGTQPSQRSVMQRRFTSQLQKHPGATLLPDFLQGQDRTGAALVAVEPAPTAGPPNWGWPSSPGVPCPCLGLPWGFLTNRAWVETTAADSSLSSTTVQRHPFAGCCI